MSKTGIVMAAAILLLAGACRPGKAKLVPEVSEHLGHEELPGLSLSALPSFFFIRGERVGVVQEDGRVFLFGADPLRLEAAETLPFPLAKEGVVAADLALLQGAGGGKVVLYDLAGRRPVREWPEADFGLNLGCSRDFRVCRRVESIVIERLDSGKLLARLDAERYPDLRVGLGGKSIWGCGGVAGFVYYTGSGLLRQFRLPRPAASGGFLDGERFFYASSDQRLVCCSAHSGRILWQRRLPAALTFPPFVFRSFVVAVTGGDTVLFMNRRGSLAWWQTLPSFIRFEPVPMTRHLAFLLQSGEMHLLDPGRRRSVKYLLPGRVEDRPARAAGFFFLTMARPAAGKSVVRFGNRFGVEIGCRPEPAFAGKSVIFEFTAFNLDSPRLAVRLEDAAGGVVLEKTILPTQPFSLAWIPPAGGSYILRVRAEGSGGIRENARAFKVLDWKEIVQGLIRGRFRFCP